MVSVLRKVLEDRKDDKHVRSSAAIALGRIGGGKSANSSLELLKSIRDSKDSADLKILKDACEWAITRLREAQSNK